MVLLEDAKRHLNVDFYYHDDDTYISSLIKVAEDAVEKRIDRKLECIIEKNNGELPDTIRHAILLLVGNWYANREPVAFASANPIPYTLEFVFDLNKRYIFV